MADKIDDVVIPILRAIQADVSVLKSDVNVLKENTGKIDLRLKIVESNMTGFMSCAKYLEHEIDQLRRRIEALEETNAHQRAAPMKAIASKHGYYILPNNTQGQPIEQAFPNIRLPERLKDAKVYQTPTGPIVAVPAPPDDAS